MPVDLHDINLPPEEPKAQHVLPHSTEGVNVLTPEQQHVVLELFARHWKEGDRHQLAMLFGGIMAKGGVSQTIAKWMLTLLCDSVGDLEKYDRMRALDDSYASHKLGQPTAAWGKLQGYMSREEIDAISFALEGVPNDPPSPGVEEGSSSTPKIRFYSGTELMETEFEKPPWIWEGVIPAGTATVLCGEPKSGKSFLAANLAIACSQGEEYQGYACMQTPVLYINFEDFIGLTKWRMIEMMGGESIPEDVYVARDPRLKFCDFEDYLEEFAGQVGARLVILDPMLRSVYLKEENDNAEAERAINPLQQFAERTGIGVVIVHHTPKASGSGVKGVRGASSIFGAVQGGVFVGRDKDEQGRFLETGSLAAVGKYGPPIDHQLRFDEEALWWERVGNDAPSFELSYARKMRMLEILSQAGRDGISIALLPDFLCCGEVEANRVLKSMNQKRDVRIENGTVWLGEYFEFRPTARSS